MTTIELIVNIVGIIAGLATVGAFIYAGLALKQVRHSDQVRLVNDILDSLSRLESEIPDLAVNPQRFELKRDAWVTRYFNKLEWISQLVNTNVIKDRALQESFKDSLIADYNVTFQNYATEEQKTNANIFPHFKKLYRKWTDQN